MKYREKLLGPGEDWLARYTSSIRDDRTIVYEVLETLKAHVAHLAEKGLVPRDAAARIISLLDEAERRPELVLREGFEDVHEAVEAYLEERLGDEAGWASLGRSRNDHVATALRLRARKLLLALLGSMVRLRETLLSKAEQHVETVIPAHTHFQPAQPTTLAHYLLSVEEALADSWRHIHSVLVEVVDRSPLGAGAAVGTSAPLDRERLARLLGFREPVVNTLYASSSRLFLYTAASAAYTAVLVLSRFAEDMVLWSHPSLGYVELPPAHLATSSLMPHKKNPATMEVLRARAYELLGDLSALAGIEAGLPSGYSLDLQEASRHAWRILRESVMAVRVAESLVRGLKATGRGAAEAERHPVVSPDLAEGLSLEKGVPYREAHRRVAEMLAKGLDPQSIAERLGLKGPLTPWESIESKRVLGSPAPGKVKEAIAAAWERARSDRALLAETTRTYVRGEEELNRLVAWVKGGAGGDSGDAQLPEA